jgi:hypothetical protein
VLHKVMYSHLWTVALRSTAKSDGSVRFAVSHIRLITFVFR